MEHSISRDRVTQRLGEENEQGTKSGAETGPSVGRYRGGKEIVMMLWSQIECKIYDQGIDKGKQYVELKITISNSKLSQTVMKTKACRTVKIRTVW